MRLGVAAGFLGGMISWLLRLEISVSGNNFLFNNHFFNVLTTAHAVVMVFFFLIPTLISGFGNMMLPFFCNVPDIAFPRINNLSYWLITPALVIILISSVVEGGAGCGWTVYPPLSTFGHPGGCVDCIIFALHLAGASSIIGRINFITTILIFGVECYESGIFVWAIFVTVFLLVLSLPVLAAGITIILFDRNVNGQFFREIGGGDPVFFQHLFWFFGHPEVYVLILPAFGVLSHAIIYSNNWNETGGYFGMCWAIAGIRVVRCVVWAHHIFTVGMDTDTRNYFTAATIVIRVPTGVKIFTWLSMLLSRQTEIEMMISWIMGFLWLFTVGRVTGITLSNNSVDLMIHDTYFVVAHFHYVLSMSATYGVVLRFLFWVRMFSFSDSNSGLNIIFFYVLFIGVNLIFFPMHEMRLDGLPRRYFSYTELIVGLCMMTILGILFTIGRWGILMIIVYVNGSSMRSYGDEGDDFVYGTGLPIHTYMEQIQNLLEISPWSLCMAMSLVSIMVNFICIFRMSIIPWSSLIVCVLVGYYWRRDVSRERSYLGKHQSIISESIMLSFILFVFSEVIFFSGFFAAIGYNLYCGELRGELTYCVEILDPLRLPFINTVLLVSSGVVATWKHESIKSIMMNNGIEVAITLRVLFIVVQYVEFNGCEFSMSSGIYGCSFFGLTGFHGFHVVVGLSLLLITLMRFYGNQLGIKMVGLDCSIIYWHLVDIIWLVVVRVVYGGPIYLC